MLRIRHLLLASAFSFACGISQAQDTSADLQRIRQLKWVINTHVGYAHLMRGMSSYTIAALRKAVTEKDIPVLVQMLRDPDDVTVMTSAETLKLLGSPGLNALAQAIADPSLPKPRRRVIENLD